jgi:hypothetical protein
MYDSRFQDATNYSGKKYRATNGNLVEHCCHIFAIYPKYRQDIEYHNGVIPLNKQYFDSFEGVCIICGEVIMINEDLVFENSEKQEKYIEEVLKEKNNEKKRSSKKE